MGQSLVAKAPLATDAISRTTKLSFVSSGDQPHQTVEIAHWLDLRPEGLGLLKSVMPGQERHLGLNVLIRQGENPDGAAFGNLGVFSQEGAIKVCLHAPRIATPTRVNCNVLFAIHGERSWWREDA